MSDHSCICVDIMSRQTAAAKLQLAKGHNLLFKESSHSQNEHPPSGPPLQKSSLSIANKGKKYTSREERGRRNSYWSYSGDNEDINSENDVIKVTHKKKKKEKQWRSTAKRKQDGGRVQTQAEGSHSIPCCTNIVVSGVKTYIRHKTEQTQNRELRQQQMLAVREQLEEIWLQVVQGTYSYQIQHTPPSLSVPHEEGYSQYSEAKRLVTHPQVDNTDVKTSPEPPHTINVVSAGIDSGVGTGLLAYTPLDHEHQSFNHSEVCDVDHASSSSHSTQQSDYSNNEQEWNPLMAETTQGNHEDYEEFYQPQNEENDPLSSRTTINNDMVTLSGRSRRRRDCSLLCSTQRRRVPLQQICVPSHPNISGPISETHLNQPSLLTACCIPSSVKLDDSSDIKGFVEFTEPLVNNAVDVYPSTFQGRNRPIPVFSDQHKYRPQLNPTGALPLVVPGNIYHDTVSITAHQPGNAVAIAFTAIAEQPEQQLCGPYS